MSTTDDAFLWSRRMLLKAGAIGFAGLAGAALIGCDDDDDDDDDGGGAATSTGTATAAATATEGPAMGQPQQGGTLRIASDTPAALDVLTSSSGAVREFGGAFYPTLIQPKGENWDNFPSPEYIPNLASVPEVTPDGLVYSFAIHPDAYWNEPLNRSVTSADVAYSYNRFLGRGYTAAPQAAELEMIEEIETPDDLSAIFHLSVPFSQFLSKVASDYNVGIMPVETGDGFDPTTTVVSSGPWLLDELVDAVSFRMVRNPKWHLGPERPYLDAIEASQIAEPANILVQFKGGNLDWITAVNPTDVRGTLAAVDGAQLRPQKGLGFAFIAFGEPRDGTAPWADDRVRKAISLGIDRASMVNPVYGGQELQGLEGVDLESIISWHNALPAGFPGQSIDPRTDSVTGQWIKHDPAEAMKLLDAAGYGDGFETEFHFGPHGSSWTLEAEILGQMLGDIGVRATIVPDAAQYFSTTFLGEFNGLAFVLQGFVEHAQFLAALYKPASARNQSRVDDEDILADILAIEQELDPEARFDLTKAIHAKLVDKMHYVPSIGWQVRWDVAAPNLRGMHDYQTYRGGNYTVEKANLWYETA